MRFFACIVLNYHNARLLIRKSNHPTCRKSQFDLDVESVIFLRHANRSGRFPLLRPNTFFQIRQIKNDQFFRNRLRKYRLIHARVPWSGKCTRFFPSTRKFFRSSPEYSKRSRSTGGRKVHAHLRTFIRVN